MASEVSDEAIEAALSVDLSAFPDFGAINRALVANVRALLDVQAAAHAAEMGRWKERHKSAMAEVERLNDSLDYANKGKAELEAEVEALRAEVEGLRKPDLRVMYGYELGVDETRADRDRAVREALENAAQKIEADQRMFLTDRRYATEAVRSLIPEGDTE